MDPNLLRVHGKEMIDYVAEYWETMRTKRKPVPDIKPGYVKHLIPKTAPEKSEDWNTIFSDLEKVIMEGNANWHHPHFFAYFPTSCSYPSIMADILSGGIGSVGFTWKSGPSMTELEMSCMDWLVSALGLPEHFKNSHPGNGCGIIQSSASDSTFVAILAARARTVENFKLEPTLFGRINDSYLGITLKKFLKTVLPTIDEEEEDDDIISPHYHDPAVFDKFIAYCSDQAHSSVEKDAMMAGVNLRKLKSTLDPRLNNYTVTVETLEMAIEEDRSRGRIPFVFVASMGSTNTCGVDYVSDLGPICNRENIWLHVDAAYAGSFLLCPEFRYMSRGLEMVDSFTFNPHKALHVNYDCSAMWLKDGRKAAKYFTVDPLYLKHEHSHITQDYRHLQIALGRRFRSLKIWFTLRAIGLQGIRTYLRGMNSRAELFSSLIETSSILTHFVPRHLGLVCFRIVNSSNELNEKLMRLINEDGRIHLVPSSVHGTFFLRLSVCSQNTNDDDIRFAFSVIEELAKRLLDSLIN